MTNTAQTSLERSPNLELVEAERDEGEGIGSALRCPDCGRDITASKGAQPTPDGRTTHGWRCDVCNNVAPCHAHASGAPGWNDRIEGIEVTFRGGYTRFIPVVKEEIE